jgi:hypothetical protein
MVGSGVDPQAASKATSATIDALRTAGLIRVFHTVSVSIARSMNKTADENRRV